MNKDNAVLEFIKSDTLEGQFKIVKEYESVARPYLISENSNELDTWISSRAIPTSREHIYKVLLSLNLDSKERFNLLLINYDYNKSMIGTFDIDNKVQAKELVIKNPQKYRKWAKILDNSIDKIDFAEVPEYRAKAMIKLLRSRCKMIQEF